jgi:hypothetical protein
MSPVRIRLVRVEYIDYVGSNAGPLSISMATGLVVIFNSLRLSLKYVTIS